MRIGKRQLKQGESFAKMLYTPTIKDAADSLLYVDDICVHPKNWGKVLKQFGRLKLCLAHYSGYTAWTKGDSDTDGDFKKKLDKSLLVDWRKDVTDLIINNPNVYTDISCFLNYEEAIPVFIDGKTYENAILGIVEEHKILTKADADLLNRCYTLDAAGTFMSYYQLNPAINSVDKMKLKHILIQARIIKDDIHTVARQLADEIIKHDKLKKRILMGSDWPMFELDFAGAGTYYAKMFELLMLVTKYVKDKNDGKKFDAWYQFSVINPLRFLGLIDDDNEKKVKKEKLERMKEALGKYLKNIPKDER